MNNGGEEKILITLTGIPGSGKSTLKKELTKRLAEGGIKVGVVMNEYGYIREWAEEAKNADLVDWQGEIFTLKDKAYNWVTEDSARKCAEEAKRLFTEEGAQVVIYEGARGARGIDKYGKDFFGPTFDVLADVDGIQIVNIEARVTDIEEVKRRVEANFKKSDGKTTPPWVPERYINLETGSPFVSAVDYINEYGGDVEIIMNEIIFNDNGMNEIRASAKDIVSRLNLISENIEGQVGFTHFERHA